MSQQPVGPPPEKTQEQIEEQLKQKLQQQRLRDEERKKVEEQARIKAEEDLRKLQEALKGSLSGLGKTASNKSMAYIRLNIAQKQLQRLFPVILRYKEIRYLDISSNTISDLTLIDGFTNLVWLNASKNQVNSLNVFNSEKLEHLQFLNLSGNKLKAVTPITLPCLKRLNLTENQITEISWKGHNYIEIFQLRKNKLRKLKGIANMKNLKQLYVCENELTDIRGLQNLPIIQKISVRNNKIKTLYHPFPYLPSLSYINLRQNQITKIQELKKIDVHVTGVNILQNPITDELGESLKKEVSYFLPHIVKINKSQVTVEQRAIFEKQMLQKIVQKERQRLAQEQEARKAAQTGG